MEKPPRRSSWELAQSLDALAALLLLVLALVKDQHASLPLRRVPPRLSEFGFQKLKVKNALQNLSGSEVLKPQRGAAIKALPLIGRDSMKGRRRSRLMTDALEGGYPSITRNVLSRPMK